MGAQNGGEDRKKTYVLGPKRHPLNRRKMPEGPGFDTRTQSYKENFRVDLRYSGILALSLAENGHMTLMSQ